MAIKTNGKRGQAIVSALDGLSYDWMTVHAPDLVAAIHDELENGVEPAGVRFIVQRHVGADREGLALRCEQAARYMKGMME